MDRYFVLGSPLGNVDLEQQMLSKDLFKSLGVYCGQNNMCCDVCKAKVEPTFLRENRGKFDQGQSLSP